MELSRRLERILSMVEAGSVVADIGTDHGFIPIELLRRGICPRAYAMDVGAGPLSRAQAHIAQAGLAEKIQTRLSDGFAALRAKEADTAVIAGMGGNLMIEILKGQAHLEDSILTWILSPQSDADRVRRFLREQGLEIVQEAMVEEDGKFYPVLKVKRKDREGAAQAEELLPKKASEEGEGLQELEDRYGPLLLRERDATLRMLLKKQREQAGRILEELREKEGERARRRCEELRRELEELERALNWNEG